MPSAACQHGARTQAVRDVRFAVEWLGRCAARDPLPTTPNH
jgi:hypothetical protein